ncbi:hypothetical protein ScPMuIL_015113 [Solemya velum]
MGFGLSCIKYSLFVFNVIFLLAGLGILGVGIWIRLDSSTFEHFLGSGSLPLVSYALMVAGSVVVLISLLGCCGAIMENKYLLTAYFIFLLLIFILEGAAGVVAFIYAEKATHIIESNVLNIIQTQYGYPDHKIISHAVDFMHSELKCCGYHTPLDWKTAKFYKDNNATVTEIRNNTQVPRSCCKNPNKEGCNENIAGNDVFQVCPHPCSLPLSVLRHHYHTSSGGSINK